MITTDASDHYHDNQDCSAFHAGRRGSKAHGYQLHDVRNVSASEAEAEGKTACPTCLEGAQ